MGSSFIERKLDQEVQLTASVSPVVLCYVCKIPELVMFPQFSLPIRLPLSPLLDAVDSQFDDIWLSVCGFYISATCYLFTFACYLLNRLIHSKTRLSWPIL